ncbi:ribonuclease H-like domain-containing protein [Mycena amicta]|nr:ribonuclease H-like domain-containing protein [Mycena amicta]
MQALPTLWDAGSREQLEFEEDLCKVFVSCNWSWRCIGNGELVLFLTKYIPHAKIPDRRTLSGRVLDSLHVKVEDRIKEAVNKKLGMGQCDGWKSSARSSIILSSVTVEVELYTLGAHNVSAQSKTADNLLELMLADMERAESEFGITFVGFCTDDGGDARGFRVRLRVKRPKLITTPCWAHQVNLVVGEGFKSKIACLKCLEPLLRIIKWFLNHSRGARNSPNTSKKTNRILTLILPVISRWIYHFLATRRMLVLSPAMRTLYLNDYDTLISCAGAKRDAQDTAREILAPIDTADFWSNVAQTKLILEPLAIAAKCMQAPDAGLDSVVLMLGNLYRIYGSNEIPTHLRNTIRKSLEKRWAAIEREPAIVALFLNPYIRGTAFQKTNLAVRPNTIYQMACTLFKRFFDVEPNLEFRAAFFDYEREKHEFSSKHMGLADIRTLVQRENQRGLMLKVWTPLDTGEVNGRNGLVKLAIWLHSIVANSAGSERGFSKFGLYLTKLCSQMAVEKVRKMYTVDMDLKRQHAELGLATERVQRRYARFAEEHEAESRSMEDYEASESFDDLAAQMIRHAEEAANENTTADSGTTSPAASDNDNDIDDDDAVYTPADLALNKIFDFSLVNTSEEADGEENAALGFYWKGGIKSLEEELQIYDLLMEDLD